MTQAFQNTAPNVNWLGQLIESLNTNPELASTLQQLATQWLVSQQGSPRKVAHSDEYIDAEYDDALPGASFDESSDVLQLFADAFGFCASCLELEDQCDECAIGSEPSGPDDRTFLALVVPVLSQLKTRTRLELESHLRELNQDITAASGRSRSAQHEHLAQY